MEKFPLGLLLVTSYLGLLGFSEGKSRAVQVPPNSWRFSPISWRYYSSSGSIPPGIESSDLFPSSVSYRSSREARSDGRSLKIKRDTSFRRSAWDWNCDMTCDGGLCVPKENRCDGYAHCWDGTDEKDCTCAKLMQKISEKKTCDGYKDCPDGMDESGCVYGCSASEFTCNSYPYYGTKAKCIPKLKVCDGRNDCPNGKDEQNCYRMVDLKEETRGVRSQGVLQKRVENEWYTVCKTPTSIQYIKTYAEKVCKEAVGKMEGTTYIKVIDLNSIKAQMSSQDIQNIKYLRIDEDESKFGVLAGCPSERVYDIYCPTPQCGGMGNTQYYAGKLRKRNTDIDDDNDDEDLDADDDDEETELIVGGHDTKDLQWPFIVGIFRDGEYYCGGSIINEEWILTAAHCNHGYEKHTFEVQAGMMRKNSWSPYEQTRHVVEIYVHESYDQKVFTNDIALYKLDKPLHLSKYVTPACLPSGATDDPAAGQQCKVAGWGDLKEGGYGPDYLQEVSLPVLAKCIETFTKDEYQICAAVLEGGMDACQGDSGGPFLCKTYDGRPVVSGLVSFGRGCARAGEAGVYTRISAYLEWINKVVNGESAYSSYQPRPQQCTEKCYKAGGECIYPEEKCNGDVTCLNAEDEMGCSTYITRSGGIGSRAQPSSRTRLQQPALRSRNPTQQSQPSPRQKLRGPYYGRSGKSEVRKTVGNCAETEFQCTTLEMNGFKDCIDSTSVCDKAPNCPDMSDEKNCVALTNDFVQLVDSPTQTKESESMKGYVMVRHEDAQWYPLALEEWNMELGQAFCNSVSPTSKAALVSLETIQMRQLADRLRSGVNLKEKVVMTTDTTENVLALSSPANAQSQLLVTKFSKAILKDMLDNGSADKFTFGYVRCKAVIAAEQ